MRCSKARKQMSAFLDGALPAGEREAMADHLARCAACAGVIQELEVTGRLLRQGERFRAPAGFSRRVMANLEPTVPYRFFSPFFVRFAEAAVLFLVIGIGVAFGRFWEPALGPPSLRAERSLLSLDLFDPAPADSLGGAYLAMMEVRDEQ